MKPDQALELLAKASAQYRGTLDEHQMLLEAIRTIQAKLDETKVNSKAAKASLKTVK